MQRVQVRQPRLVLLLNRLVAGNLDGFGRRNVGGFSRDDRLLAGNFDGFGRRNVGGFSRDDRLLAGNFDGFGRRNVGGGSRDDQAWKAGNWEGLCLCVSAHLVAYRQSAGPT